MENLSQWIVYGAIIAVSYMFVGYHIAQLSRELQKNWGKHVLGSGIPVLPLKLILYPIVFQDTEGGRAPEWFLYHDYKYYRPSYVIFHLFLWPIRIAGNFALLMLLYLTVPVGVLLISLVTRMIVSVIEAIAGKSKGEASS